MSNTFCYFSISEIVLVEQKSFIFKFQHHPLFLYFCQWIYWTIKLIFLKSQKKNHQSKFKLTHFIERTCSSFFDFLVNFMFGQFDKIYFFTCREKNNLCHSLRLLGYITFYNYVNPHVSIFCCHDNFFFFFQQLFLKIHSFHPFQFPVIGRTGWVYQSW